ncbi:hypothetical protein QUB56_11575 [Microcoleus sp. AR_TQ3_B6]|uniref:hypothetical protein n=1 Tax=Microcoleus sp. AR_TQ3_B6 TaxID=3055284 RepID=UPI002FD6FF79
MGAIPCGIASHARTYRISYCREKALLSPRGMDTDTAMPFPYEYPVYQPNLISFRNIPTLHILFQHRHGHGSAVSLQRSIA